jgi:hypothetical protein
MNLPSALRRGWSSVQTGLGSHPAIYLPLARFRYGTELTYGPATDIVIEGFPRSANTFAVTAFNLAQPRRLTVAHHIHAAAQVMCAVRDEVPALVLIRPPEDAILSFLLWHPHLRLPHAVRLYQAFHRPLLPLADSIVVASFDEVTEDFGAVTRRVNDRFSSSFAEFDHTPENVARCFEEIERRSAAQRGHLMESVVARPSDDRKAMKAAIRERYARDVTSRDQLELKRLHEALMGR